LSPTGRNLLIAEDAEIFTEDGEDANSSPRFTLRISAPLR
jgi:hypothetical protein